MKLIADALIDLPFKLDFCAKGPDVDPLTCQVNGMDATLYFPPSLSEGTDGQGIFGEWAWWTGKTLRLVLERDIEDVSDVEALRNTALATGNEILRRFLNSYRTRLRRADVHPIQIDARVLTLELVGDDGQREMLSEPVSAFFYQRMPPSPPLDRSVNATTLDTLLTDVRDAHEPTLAEQLRLDADALDSQGESERAAVIRNMAEAEVM